MGLPLMVHIGDTVSPLPRILAMLKPAIWSRTATPGREGGIFDDRDRVLPEVRRARREQHPHLDVGHGAGSFAFRVAEAAVGRSVLPGTISSDVHQSNINGQFTTWRRHCLNSFISVSLEDVIRRVTARPRESPGGFPSGTGSLAPGSIADVAVFELREAPWEMVDSVGDKRLGKLRLRPIFTLKGSQIYGNSVIPVYR